jgi:hypothetical protein
MNFVLVSARCSLLLLSPAHSDQAIFSIVVSALAACRVAAQSSVARLYESHVLLRRVLPNHIFNNGRSIRRFGPTASAGVPPRALTEDDEVPLVRQMADPLPLAPAA